MTFGQPLYNEQRKSLASQINGCKIYFNKGQEFIAHHNLCLPFPKLDEQAWSTVETPLENRRFLKVKRTISSILLFI